MQEQYGWTTLDAFYAGSTSGANTGHKYFKSKVGPVAGGSTGPVTQSADSRPSSQGSEVEVPVFPTASASSYNAPGGKKWQ